MRYITNLDKLGEGQHARVLRLTADDGIRRRMQDIGLIQGTPVKCLQKSPFRDPVAFLIRGAVIALRAEDSSQVLVEYDA